MSPDLTGPWALVVGAGSGIGLATTVLLARWGKHSFVDYAHMIPLPGMRDALLQAGDAERKA
jgi:NAD(P)-dependent dehydrogenase (short-subunit alcohol dehydrogenase family)